MRKKSILITGAAGELGQALLDHFLEVDGIEIIALDLKPPAMEPREGVTAFQASIVDDEALAELENAYTFETIFHLAALLSTSCEHSPEKAHHVNVNGTLNLLRIATRQSARSGKPVRFIFPSSIAVYGLPDRAIKQREGALSETDWNCPHTIYGSNKLYCEHLGRYYSLYYGQLAQETPVRVDFRCLRYPGLISADTLPSGGTSDYAPEMIHSAAQGQPYTCFVSEETTIPFMVMPDAVKAMLMLAEQPRQKLCQTVYNVTSFSRSAEEIARKVLAAFPAADVTFQPDPTRQAIVDSWPFSLDDSAARRDWGWQPDYDFDQSFGEYLIPSIARRYAE